VQSGRRWVVDVDFEKFLDRVQHDVLMGLVRKRISDPRMVRLIRRYLEAGIMANGVVMERHEGTPQGGPLSPLLANVLLDVVDKQLERRGHRFVLVGLTRLYAKLKLTVNASKSAVAPAQVVALLRRYLVGWKACFRLADTPGIFTDVDQWLHRRLRMLILKQRKRGTTLYRTLRARGNSDRSARAAAAHCKRWRAMATHGALKSAYPTQYFIAPGVPRLGPS
jgi:retron-type reverse transcriptase